MAKYIDADILRKEIIRLRKDKPFHDDSSFLAYLHGLSGIEDFINLLQQEQPIQVNTLTWRDINDIERIINNVHYEFRNGIGEKSFGEEVLKRFREERDEQELPNVDLRREIEKYFDGWFDGDEYGQAIMGASRNHYCACVDDCKDIARHFYELGQKDAAHKYDAGFKAGSQWLAEQGVSVEANIRDCSGSGYLSLVMPNNLYNRYKSFNDGDRVIVQVRKKEESK